MRDNKIRIATRDSKLAMAQSIYVSALLAQSGLACAFKPTKSAGDLNLWSPLSDFGGKGAFVKGIQKAVLEGGADIAVHSMKDLPLQTPDELNLVFLPPRAAAADVIVWADPKEGLHGKTLSASDLAAMGELRVGTSSLRRSSLLKMASTKIKSVPIRGNIQRRIHQLKSSGKFDAIVIAEAALQRLPSLLQHVSWSRLDPRFFIPSPAQGCIAVEASSASAKRIINAVSSDEESVRATTVERGVLAGVGGDCRTPIGVHSQRCGNHIVTRAVILDGRGEEVRAQIHSDADEPAALTVDRVLEALHAQSLYLVLDSILGSPQS